MKARNKIRDYFLSIGLKKKFIFTITGTILLLGLMVTLFVHNNQTGILKHSLQRRGITITRNLAVNAVNPILTQNIMVLQRLVKDIKEVEKDIVYIYILGSKKSLLVHTFENGFPTKLARINTPTKNRKYSHMLLKTEEGYIRDIAVPILEDLGVVHVGMSENLIRQTINRTTWTLLIMTLVIMVLGMLISSFIVAWVLKPLDSLTLAAKKIGSGNIDYTLQIETEDEIGILGAAFKKMIKELSKHRQHLKELIEERTAELKRTNEALESEVTERKCAENEIQRKHQIQSALNKMLSISMKPLSLEEMLDHILDQIVSIPWLTLKSKGAIFLKEVCSNELVLKSSRELPESLKSMCRQVPLGRCLCGKAAEIKELQFAGCLDERHENRYEGIFPHGHYCVPILYYDNVLGVLNLYVKEGHQRNKEEEDFLNAIANVLAGIIQRKLAEEELSKHRNHLEGLVKERTKKLARANEQLNKEITEHKQAKEEIKARQKEIEEINATLEVRVQKEVEKSHQKDLLLMQQSRLAAMGEMVGNIAHQWRQPLNALNILLYNIKDFCENKNLSDKEIDSLVAKGNSLIEKMSMTINDFRRFFKPGKAKKKFSINKTVKYSLSLFEDSFKFHNISVKVDESGDLSYFGFPNEYSQIIINILSNAKDAIVAKGINGEIQIEILQENNSAVVRIKDNGGGISYGILDRIFDPYYSTKAEGEGTGIGLYMSKMIIEKHMNGHISAKNTKQGAEFEIKLPMIRS